MFLLLNTDMVDWESISSHDGSIVGMEACAIMTANWMREVPAATVPPVALVAVVDGMLIEVTGVPAPCVKVSALAPDDGVGMLCSGGELVGLPLLLCVLPLLLVPLLLVPVGRVHALEGVL